MDGALEGERPFERLGVHRAMLFSLSLPLHGVFLLCRQHSMYMDAGPLLRLAGPCPLIDLRLVDAVFVCVIHAIDLHVPQHILGMGSGNLQ